MQLPNADHAFVEPAKVRDYLLSVTHPVGRFKAAVFIALGYSSELWDVLREDLLVIARTGAVSVGQPSLYGQKYEVDGSLLGPSGRSAKFRTVWIVDQTSTRFVTAFPR